MPDASGAPVSLNVSNGGRSGPRGKTYRAAVANQDRVAKLLFELNLEPNKTQAKLLNRTKLDNAQRIELLTTAKALARERANLEKLFSAKGLAAKNFQPGPDQHTFYDASGDPGPTSSDAPDSADGSRSWIWLTALGAALLFFGLRK